MLPRLLPGLAHRYVRSCVLTALDHQEGMRITGCTELMWHASAGHTNGTRGLGCCNGQRNTGVDSSRPRARAPTCRSPNQHNSRLYAAAVEERSGSSCSPSSHLVGTASAAVELGGLQEAHGRPRLQLRPGEVHVWWLYPDDVSCPSLLAAYEELLAPEERAHVMAAGSAALRKERLLARVLVRTTLSRYCGAAVVPRSLAFSRSEAGKPALRWEGAARREGPGARLQFNLTHTGSLLGCAVTAGPLVGLDVEASGRHTTGDSLSLARRRFSPAEIASLERCEGAEERARHFVRLWTLKEAYVKAVGRGIGARPGMNAFSLTLHPRCGSEAGHRGPSHSKVPEEIYNIAFAAPEGEPGDWDFLLFSPSALHTAALCMQRCGLSSSTAESSSSADWHVDARSRDRESIPAPAEASNGAALAESTRVVGSSTVCGKGSRLVATAIGSTGAVHHTDTMEMHCWRTVPLSHDIPMDQDDCCVLGSSRLSS